MANTDLRYFDKLFSNQPPVSGMYEGLAADYPKALYDLILSSSTITPTEQRFKLAMSDKFTIEEMGSSPVYLRILEFFTALSRAKSALEIGTFIGVSAMAIASAMPADGYVVTIEKFDHFADIARRNIAINGFSEKIELIEGDAADVIESFGNERMFDLVFIDGNKERYADYFLLAVKHLNPGGLILVDDAFFHGDVINVQPSSEKGRGVRAFMDLAATRHDFFRLALPVANGLMALLHRPEVA